MQFFVCDFVLSFQIYDYHEYKEIQQKVNSMEKEIENYIIVSMELRQALKSATNKALLAESLCDRYV